MSEDAPYFPNYVTLTPKPDTLAEFNAAGTALVRPDGLVYPLATPGNLAPTKVFTKAANPLFIETQSIYTKFFWWWVVKVDGVLASPLGKYYAYFSTDHDAGDGGISLAYADSPIGPWIFYGEVLVDNIRSTSPATIQTETPSVLAQSDGTIRMFYHVVSATVAGLPAQGVQSTLSATSANGITWVHDETFILDEATFGRDAGNGHTGYFTPSVYNNRWYGYSLFGSGDYPHYKLHVCNGDLNDWSTDPRGLGYHQDRALMADGVVRHVVWSGSFIVEKNGSPYLLSTLGSFISGGATGNNVLAMARLSGDLRAPIGKFTPVWSKTLDWEGDSLMSSTPFVEGSTLYVYYVTRLNNVDRVGVLTHEL